MDENNEQSKVVFEGAEFQRPIQSFQKPTPKIIQLVIKCSGGYIKNEKQASNVLILLVVVAIIISLFLVFSGNNQKLSPEEKYFQNIPSELI